MTIRDQYEYDHELDLVLIATKQGFLAFETIVNILLLLVVSSTPELNGSCTNKLRVLLNKNETVPI